MHQISSSSKLISLREATKHCDYSQDYLNLLVRKGSLKALKIGRNWVTTKEWLDEYLERAGIKRNDLVKICMPGPSEIENSEPESAVLSSKTSKNGYKKIRDNFFYFGRPRLAVVLFALAAVLIGGLLINLSNRPLLDVHKRLRLAADVSNLSSANFSQSFFNALNSLGGKAAGAFNYLIHGKTEVVTVIENKTMGNQVDKIVLQKNTENLEENLIGDTQNRINDFRKEFNLPVTEKTQAENNEGLIVVPSGDGGYGDQQTLDRIKESFSDEVTVTPADSSSGIIVPRFKKDAEQPYLYMMVPVNEVN